MVDPPGRSFSFCVRIMSVCGRATRPHLSVDQVNRNQQVRDDSVVGAPQGRTRRSTAGLRDETAQLVTPTKDTVRCIKGLVRSFVETADSPVVSVITGLFIGGFVDRADCPVASVLQILARHDCPKPPCRVGVSRAHACDSSPSGQLISSCCGSIQRLRL